MAPRLEKKSFLSRVVGLFPILKLGQDSERPRRGFSITKVFSQLQQWGLIGVPFAVAVLLLGWSGMVFRRVQQSRDVPISALADIKMSQFARNVKSVGKFRLFGLPAYRRDLSLLDPRTTLPRTFEFPPDVAKMLSDAELKCRPELATPDGQPKYAKLFEWIAFQCGRQPDLSDKFFETFPYMHYSGKSFASLYIAKKRSLGPEKIKRLTPYLHVLEYRGIDEALFADPMPHIAQRLSRGQLDAVLYKSPVAPGPEFLLLYRSGGQDHLGLTYEVYPIEQWNQFEGVPYLRFGRQGWSIDHQRMAIDERRAFSMQLSAFFLMALSVTTASWRAWKTRRHEFKRRLFNIQMLSHELRTPVAAIKLNLEDYQVHYDQLPPAVQASFARLNDNVARLGRLMAASRQFLQSVSRQKISFNVTHVDSLRTFLQEIVDVFNGSVEFDYLGPDFAVLIDPFWIQFCIENLVRNALQHGRPPVVVGCRASKSDMEIYVKDQGVFPSTEFDRSRLFTIRGNDDAGLGLGLHLTRQVVEDMGGTITHSSPPTVITIHLKRVTA